MIDDQFNFASIVEKKSTGEIFAAKMVSNLHFFGDFVTSSRDPILITTMHTGTSRSEAEECHAILGK